MAKKKNYFEHRKEPVEDNVEAQQVPVESLTETSVFKAPECMACELLKIGIEVNGNDNYAMIMTENSLYAIWRKHGIINTSPEIRRRILTMRLDTQEVFRKQFPNRQYVESSENSPHFYYKYEAI